MGQAQPKIIIKKTGRPQPKMKLGRSRPKNFYSLGQDWPRLARLAQQPRPSGGRINFLPSPPACRTILHAGGKHLQKTKKIGGEENVYLRGGGRWWSYGGVARVRLLRAVLWRFPSGGEKRFSSSSPFLFRFRSFSLFLPLSLFSVFFSFVFGLFLSLFPLPCSFSLSLPSLSLLRSFFQSPSLSFGLPIYRKKMEQVSFC